LKILRFRCGITVRAFAPHSGRVCYHVHDTPSEIVQLQTPESSLATPLFNDFNERGISLNSVCLKGSR
jgi:hypothetical protein